MLFVLVSVWPGLAAVAPEAPAQAFARGEFSRAESGWRQMLDRERTAPTAQESKIASLEFNLAAAIRAQGRYPEAESLYQDVLQIFSRVEGPEGVSQTRALRGLALLYMAQGYPDRALQFVQRALDITETRGLHDTGSAESLLLRASVRFRKDDTAEATVDVSEALRRLQSAGKQDTTSYAEGLNLLGLIAQNRDQFDAASQYYRQALQLTAELLGTAHPNYAVMLNNLARTRASAGDRRRAEELFAQAIRISTAAYGPNHPDIAVSLCNLAQVYSDAKQYAKAQRPLEHALHIDLKTFGPASARVASDLNRLGTVAMARRHYDEALPYLSRSLAVTEQVHGSDDPQTGLVAANLAELYLRCRQYRAAEPLFARAVRIRERNAGPNDMTLANLLQRYGTALRANEEYAEAAQAETRALGLRVRAVKEKASFSANSDRD